MKLRLLLSALLSLTFPIAAKAQKKIPVVLSLNPTSTDAGVAVTLDVTGSNYSNSTVITWNGANQATTIVSSTVRRISVTAGMVASAGTAQVGAFTPGGQGGHSTTTLTFTITDPPPPSYDFSLSISGPTHVVQGHNLYLRLDMAILSGTRDLVQFSVNGLPSGATASFPDLEATCCGPTTAWAPAPTALKISASPSTTLWTFAINVTAVSGGVTKLSNYLITVDPVPAALPFTPIANYSAIPSLASWESHMVSFGQTHCAGLQDPQQTAEQKLGATYYDAERIYYAIGAYTQNAAWNVCAVAAEAAYRDAYVIPNNGGIPGFWNFTAGLRRDMELTGDTVSRDTVLLLSQNASFTSGELNLIIPSYYSREVAYAINAYIDAEKLGYPRNPRLTAYVDILLGHLDQWFVSLNSRCPSQCDPAAAAWQYYVQPFMVGLAAETLIQYHAEIESDPRIPVAVKNAADWLWSHAWDAPSGTFWYDNWIADPAQIPSGYWTPHTPPLAHDLNLLIAPAYAWLYRQTGDDAYRDQGDAIFVGGVNGAWLDGVKQFNQSYRWSFDYVKWRSGN